MTTLAPKPAAQHHTHVTSPAPDALFMAFQDAVAGRYSLDRELGRGGMGIVYLAREVRLDRLVALKLLPPELAAEPELRKRFLREARLAARLSHPNIIPIHAVEEIGDFVFFAMSYIDGETLTQRVQGRGPLSAAEGARVLREAAWALAYAHEQGLIHRDVKPDNILLEAGSGRVLVADFGIASVADDHAASSSGGITGTPEFMSPEQALGEPLDARSDLYALGATAFYMYSGRFVFDGRTPMEIIGRRVTETAPPVASLGCPVPRRIALIIDRCLSRDPARRPTNGQLLAAELGAAMEERRELPAPLRSFLTTAKLSGRETFAGSVGVLAATALGASLFGVAGGWTALVAGAVLLPVTAWIVAARQLIKDGFEHTDVVSAFKSAALREREERVGVAPASLTERAVRWYAIVVTPTAFVLNWTLKWNSLHLYYELLGQDATLRAARILRPLWQTYDMLLLTEVYLPIVVASGAFAGVAALGLLAGRRDVDSAFWSRVWTRGVGRALFAVARKLVGRGARRVAVTHRATELSLGLAADALYAQLPRATRESLSEMPIVLQRLQTDAQRLRAEIDRLQEALNDAGAAALSDEFAPIRETRDELLARHRDAVAQLETLRLGLLRLHAGAVSVDTVTTHLRLASEVSEHVERLISARAELVKDLEYPRSEVPSPV